MLIIPDLIGVSVQALPYLLKAESSMITLQIV